jgi:lysophospholipase L1-like esterase
MRNSGHIAVLLALLSAFGIVVRAQQTTAGARRPTGSEEKGRDWASLERYQAANAALLASVPEGHRVVFLGDSITDAWNLEDFFPGRKYINRGIGGQTTPQMLIRFRQDVIALKPKVVVILAGTNDVAENTGPTTLEAIEDNLASMADIAQSNHVHVILSSILPVLSYPWRKDIQPVERISALNNWMKGFAAGRGLVYLDYFSAMQDEHHGLKTELSEDGVHPNKIGYAKMAPLVEQAISEALEIESL